MATERLPMRHIREILRLKWCLNRSHRETARSLGISPGAVASVISRATGIGLTWDALEELTDDALEQRLYGPKVTGRRGAPAARSGLDPHRTAARRRHAGAPAPGVSAAASGRLSLFRLLRALPRLARRGSACRCGRCTRPARSSLSITPARSRRSSIRRPGSCAPVELFVAVLGASNYTYAEATETQRSADFIQSHGRAVEYLGGVPAAIVPDQLKTGIRDACRYEPILQRTYEEWAAHYTTAILPARPAKPRDKAKVEVAVQVAQRWILARLRHETFFSLARAERADPRAARGSERPADEGLRRGLPPGSLHALRSAGAAAVAGRALRLHRVAPGAREHRLSRRRRAPSLLRAASAHSPDRRSSTLGHDRRSLSARHADLGASPQSSRRRLHHHPRAHAARPPGASGVESRRA